ncbi:T9SS type A sorting domain-containing protein [Tamlana agarivorans]|uniref:T9SS type A sorting domain-containing protein n=1 Tax=Pseudotamlana agarivorans TaxID=481183 RepID=A0ACC5U8L9_9FLAO|nr:T9SS type A sorting domain-containing protein [Tamlana agarivorans]MBU2950664.1 T9SS type A sorting domain-containing protein [Tamlana agarivorans]
MHNKMGAKYYTIKKIRLFAFLFLLTGTFVFSQGHLREIPLEKQIQNSDLVIEGKVISKTAFWGADNHIYTKNSIEVYKVFKGEVVSKIDLVTAGGTVGFDCQIVTHSLKLNVGDLGVFTLINSSDLGLDATNYYKAYSGVQGYYKYNLYSDAVANPFSTKKGIVRTFYNELSKFTKLHYKIVRAFSVNNETSRLNEAKSSLVPSGISFSPTNITAGTRSTIKISKASGATGGFGLVQGKVSFRNADTGGEDDMANADFIDALDSQIISWTTNEITVQVPTEAGTGTIRVTDASANVIESVDVLTVTYALLNAVFNVNAGSGSKNYAFPTRLVNNDGSGGYEFQLETSFNADNEHPGAKDDFFTALETWRCETGVNFGIGPVTSVDKADPSDGVNIVRFDNGTELPDGTLGRTTYSFTLCANNNDVLNDSEVFPTDIDMVFDNEASWHFGGGSPGFFVDFQDVSLHELGHAHQLGHVINEFGDIMHYSTSRGQQIRDLSDDNKLAGAVILRNSLGSLPVAPCFGGKSAMVPIGHSGCTLSTAGHVAGHDSFKLYPNPTNGLLYVQGADALKSVQLIVYDVSGRQVLEKYMDNPTPVELIDLTNLTKGVYFVKILAKDGALTKKVIVD